MRSPLSGYEFLCQYWWEENCWEFISWEGLHIRDTQGLFFCPQLLAILCKKICVWKLILNIRKADTMETCTESNTFTQNTFKNLLLCLPYKKTMPSFISMTMVESCFTQYATDFLDNWFSGCFVVIQRQDSCWKRNSPNNLHHRNFILLVDCALNKDQFDMYLINSFSNTVMHSFSQMTESLSCYAHLPLNNETNRKTSLRMTSS